VNVNERAVILKSYGLIFRVSYFSLPVYRVPYPDKRQAFWMSWAVSRDEKPDERPDAMPDAMPDERPDERV
jgi:hypothetical protein